MIQIDNKNVIVIDVHAHVWDKLNGWRFGDKPIENLGFGRVKGVGVDENYFMPGWYYDNSSPYGALLVCMDDAGVDAAVLLQSPCFGDCRDYVREALDKAHNRFPVAFGMMDPRREDMLSDLPALYKKKYDFSGIKIQLPNTPFIMDDPKYDSMWKSVMDHDMIVAIDMGWDDTPYDFNQENLDRLSRVLKKYKGMRVFLPHLGVSRCRDRGQKYPYPWLQKTLKLLELAPDNLYFDISGLPLVDYMEQEYPCDYTQEFWKAAYESIGADRLMWGSAYPTVLKTITYRQSLDLLVKHCLWMPRADKLKILNENAQKFFGILVKNNNA